MALPLADVADTKHNLDWKHAMGGTVPPARASNRLDWLDALRGWAVFGVVAVHAGQAAHSTGIEAKITASGQYGVQLFFVVSALTISLTYESHIARYGGSLRSQGAWLTKRFFRIAPLYYLAALFYPMERYAIYVATHHQEGQLPSGANILANLLFLHTWIPAANNSVVPGGWSIGVEMFFYLLVPLVWLVRPMSRRIALLVASILVCLGSTLLLSRLITGSLYVKDNSYLYYWFPAQAPVIVLGLLFYIFCGSRLQCLHRRKPSLAYLGGFLVTLSAALYCGTFREAAPILAPTIFAASCIFLILGLQGWVRSIVVHPYAIILGRLSFSVYIFHFFVLDCIRALLKSLHWSHYGPLTLFPILAAALLLTSAIAYASKRAIEDPAIAYGHRLSRSIALGGAPSCEALVGQEQGRSGTRRIG